MARAIQCPLFGIWKAQKQKNVTNQMSLKYKLVVLDRNTYLFTKKYDPNKIYLYLCYKHLAVMYCMYNKISAMKK